MLREYYTTKPQAQLDEEEQGLMIYERKILMAGRTHEGRPWVDTGHDVPYSSTTKINSNRCVR
jgi:hypothetical protein